MVSNLAASLGPGGDGDGNNDSVRDLAMAFNFRAKENSYLIQHAFHALTVVYLLGIALNILGSVLVLVNYQLLYHKYVEKPIHPGIATHYRMLRYFAVAHLDLSLITLVIVSSGVVRSSDWMCVLQAGITVYSQVNVALLVTITCWNL